MCRNYVEAVAKLKDIIKFYGQELDTIVFSSDEETDRYVRFSFVDILDYCKVLLEIIKPDTPHTELTLHVIYRSILEKYGQSMYALQSTSNAVDIKFGQKKDLYDLYNRPEYAIVIELSVLDELKNEIDTLRSQGATKRNFEHIMTSIREEDRYNVCYRMSSKVAHGVLQPQPPSSKEFADSIFGIYISILVHLEKLFSMGTRT